MSAVARHPLAYLVAFYRGRLVGVQVKSTTGFRNGRWVAALATRGGNRSWSGVAKYFSSERCDFLFVHAGDGRRWFIPAERVEARAGLILGGPKYAEFEVARGEPIPRGRTIEALSSSPPWWGSRAVKGVRL